MLRASALLLLAALVSCDARDHPDAHDAPATLFRALAVPECPDGIRAALAKAASFVEGNSSTLPTSLKLRVRISAGGDSSTVTLIACADGSIRMRRYTRSEPIPMEYGASGAVGWALDPGADFPRLIEPAAVWGEASLYSPLDVLNPIYSQSWLHIEELPKESVGSSDVRVIRFHGRHGARCDLSLIAESGEPIGARTWEERDGQLVETDSRWLAWRSTGGRRYPSIIDTRIGSIKVGYIVETFETDTVLPSETALPPEVFAVKEGRMQPSPSTTGERKPQTPTERASDRPADRR